MKSHSSIDSLKIKAKLLQKAKLKVGKEFALKEAYSLLAKTAGYKDWKEMKDSYYEADLLNPPKWSAQWKIWFNSKEEALLHFNRDENYLLPYRKQFFICDLDYIRSLGIADDDNDLIKIGHDWTAPKDLVSWKNLLAKISKK